MPDEVALELRQLQSGYTPTYRQENYGAYAFTRPIKPRSEQRKNRSGKRESEEVDSTEVEFDENAKKRYAIKDVVIDFDELVNKVIDKLKDEFEEKKKAGDKKNRHGRQKDKIDPDIETGKDVSLALKNIYKFNANKEKAKEPREAWKHFKVTKSPQTVTSDSYTSHIRKPKKKSKKQEARDNANDDFFESDDLTKVKDSYEDYITPKRDKIYASDTETETMNPKSKGAPKENHQENEEQKEELPNAADILKAGKSSDKIRKMRKLDDPINFAKEDYDPNETKKPVDHSEKARFVKLGGESDEKPAKMKGTMIPTRQIFKMSSPNYYGKLVAVAEKYDFNEPLPEKDRERENLKHYFNPPARINKKVKLRASSEVE